MLIALLFNGGFLGDCGGDLAWRRGDCLGEVLPCMYVCMYVCMHVCMCEIQDVFAIYVCMFVWMYVFMCV